MKRTELQEALKATSTVIELKKGKKYLLVFKLRDDNHHYVLQELAECLQKDDITAITIAIRKDEDIEIIEQ